MSYTYYIDPFYNDFRITNGTLQLARGSDAIRQQIQVTLSTELGEWFLDTTVGIPYYSKTGEINDNNNAGILGGKYSAAEISAIIRRAILSVPGVLSLLTLELEEDRASRALNINGSCTVESGEVNGIGTQNQAIIEFGVSTQCMALPQQAMS